MIIEFIRKIFKKTPKPDEWGPCSECGSLMGIPTYFSDDKIVNCKYMYGACVEIFKNQQRELRDLIVKKYGDRLAKTSGKKR